MEQELTPTLSNSVCHKFVRPLIPKSNVNSLRWGGGYMVGETPEGRVTPVPKKAGAKASGAASAGGRRRIVAKYSSSYWNLSYVPD